MILIPALFLMSCIALAIYIEDRGNIIYKQKRVGENGQIFEILKFRSMIQNAEDIQYIEDTTGKNRSPVYKNPKDPRITRVGRFLRRTSLDELPQLFNTLKGEMSLVGPRPELPFFVDRYAPWQFERLTVPQGITGWWQVNGRSDKPMYLHTEDDIYYIHHYSLLLDLFILVKTVWVVIKGKGAY